MSYSTSLPEIWVERTRSELQGSVSTLRDSRALKLMSDYLNLSEYNLHLTNPIMSSLFYVAVSQAYALHYGEKGCQA